MCVYLRVTFQVSSIIGMGFRQGVILFPHPSNRKPQNEALKSPPSLALSDHKPALLLINPFRQKFSCNI